MQSSKMEDPYTVYMKELEVQVTKLRDENEKVKNALEVAKGEINRLNSANDFISLQMYEQSSKLDIDKLDEKREVIHLYEKIEELQHTITANLEI